MMRSIPVSTDVFATIWARRKDGENSEDEILRRVLGCSVATGPADKATTSEVGGGVFDVRNNVRFPEGFEIFRTYKRREYAAVARSGFWVRKDDGSQHATLNQLNNSIAAGPENVWNGNWKYRDKNGSIHSIDELRR